MGYDRDLSFVYFGPTKIVFGAGTSRDVDIEMAGLGCRKALVVTDPGVMKAGLVEGVREALGGAVRRRLERRAPGYGDRRRE